MKCRYSNAYQLLTYLSLGSSALTLVSRADSLLYCVLRCCIFFVTSGTDTPRMSDIARNSSLRFCLSLRVSHSDGFHRLAFTWSNSTSFNVLSFDHSIVCLSHTPVQHSTWASNDKKFLDWSLDYSVNNGSICVIALCATRAVHRFVYVLSDKEDLLSETDRELRSIFLYHR